MLSRAQDVLHSVHQFWVSIAHPVHEGTAVMLASASSNGVTLSPDFGQFLQYGVLGLVVIGFATGWIVPGPQAKALAAENARLSAMIEGKLFPMIEQHAATMEKAAAALERSAEAMDRQAERERLAYDASARSGPG